ncbi:hypothetical protein [Rouxiella sp. WC2420]|uniref:Phage tail protein n=1 Tax=Rouxiella sp. WC2420 TaxID=3234145 RepID=A0AB39VM43_9GAMM
MKTITIDDKTGFARVIITNDMNVAYVGQVKLSDYTTEDLAITAATTSAQTALDNAASTTTTSTATTTTTATATS